MKTFRSSLLLAALAFSLAITPAAFCAGEKKNTTAAAGKPAKGIDVAIQRTPSNVTFHQTAQPAENGSYTIQLKSAGTYKISYASGPRQGQLIKTVSVANAGPVSLSVPGGATR